jgi:ferredoxin
MEVEIKFEPSGRNGVVAVGSYVLDAARRLGVKIEDEFGEEGLNEACFVKIIKGNELLSKPTKVELEHLSQQNRKKDERLPSQAKIEKPGEIVVMVTEKQKPEATVFESFKKEFDELPLDEKVRNLLELESLTLSETLSYIFNLPSTIGEKIRDGIAEFGFKIEQDEKNAKRPDEHKAEETKAEAKKSETAPVDKDEPIAADYSEEKAAPKKKPTTRKRAAAKPTPKSKDETK